MIEFLSAYDTRLFIFINHFWHNSFSDIFFSLLSGAGTWGFIWVIIAVIIFFWEEKKNHQKLIAIFLGVGISAIVVEIVKSITKRVRPEVAVPFTISISEKSSSYSFPSGHATIAFAAAYILSRQHKKLKWFYYLLAFLISYSRIYLGKHYPSDVVTGAFLGLFMGFISYKLADWRIKKP